MNHIAELGVDNGHIIRPLADVRGSSSRLRYALPALLACIATPVLAADLELQFQSEIRPLLETHCYRCHNDEVVNAEVNLRVFSDHNSVLEGRKIWERVLRVLREQEMPPVEPLPDPDERERLISWVDEAINHVSWEQIRHSGRVTMPRLSSVEYNNSIRDLTGIDLKPADSFPADGSGQSGFTNDREGLFIPPLLLERYFAAAKQVVTEVLAQRRAEPLSMRVEVEDLRITETNTPLMPWGYDLWKYQDTLYQYVRFPRSGDYNFAVRAWGQSENKGELPGVTVRVGGRIVGQEQVAATEAKPRVYQFSSYVPLGNHRVSLHWYKATTAETNEVNRELVASAQRARDEAIAKGQKPTRNGKAVRISLDYLDISDPESVASPIFIAEPSSKLSEQDAARQILVHFASRAYRRPVRPDEVDYLMGRFSAGAESGLVFDEAVGKGLEASLVSPSFLFRVEQLPGTGEARQLDDYEMASRLSYFLWMSMPDDELFDLAARSKLREPAILERQISRMLADPKSEAFTQTFPAEWLGYRELGGSVRPDDVEFPDFTPALARAMHVEVSTFFADMIRRDQSILELIDSDSTFLNEDLAQYYGVDGVVGREVRQVRLEGSPRGGILGMGAVLTATSLPVRTSPVVRGKWVLETLLGLELPPPPPDAGDLPEPTGELKTLTMREMYELHRRGPQCASCHRRIDPIGFGLENFDATGRWRESENGQPIDTTGELPGGERFDGPNELKQILLRDRDKFARTVTEAMLRFALGRELEYYDQPTIGEITERVIADDYRAQTLIREIVSSYPFRYQAAAE